MRFKLWSFWKSTVVLTKTSKWKLTQKREWIDSLLPSEKGPKPPIPGSSRLMIVFLRPWSSGFGTSAFRRNRWVDEKSLIAPFLWWIDTPLVKTGELWSSQRPETQPSKKWRKWDTGIFYHKKWRLLPVARYILLCCPFLVLVNHSFTVFSSSRLMARWCKQTCWGAALAKLYPCHAWEPVLYCLVAHCPCCIHLAELVRWPGQS